MKFRRFEPGDYAAVERLFVSTFSASEGQQEGTAIGRLVAEIVDCAGSEDVHGFLAVDRGRIVGAIFFSRLTFDHPVNAFLLSPVAVDSDRQGMGIGSALIAHGLREMARKGVDFVATYGNPAFYSKVGFRPISKDVIRPPHELSRPEGWLGQSLTKNSLARLSGSCACVPAFDDPALW